MISYLPKRSSFSKFPQSSSSYDEGSLRLKIKPREAEVYVDGYEGDRTEDPSGIPTPGLRLETRAASK